MGGPDCTLQFIGTATMLLRLGPFTLLTDPNFLHRGQHAYLGYGLTSKRRTEPALQVDELPPLDAIVLSHLHGDHWDRVAQRGLDHDLPVVTTPDAARTLRRRGFRHASGLGTWQKQQLSSGAFRLTISSMPGRHAPGMFGALLPPVMGSMLELWDGERLHSRVYVTGDTLLVDDLREIPRRYPDIDSSVLHLGGTRLLGTLMVTMDDRQGADLLEMLPTRQAIPVHHDDYRVFKSPLSAFQQTVEKRGLADRVTYVERGETVPLLTRAAGRPAAHPA